MRDSHLTDALPDRGTGTIASPNSPRSEGHSAVPTRAHPYLIGGSGLNSPVGLIIAYIPIVLPLVIWMLEGFFREFPEELLEAARLDGLGTLRSLIRIVLPLSRPAIAVAALFGFLSAWNEFVIALTLTSTPRAQTMPVGIASYVTQFQTLWGQMTAASVLYLVPVLIATLFAQRHIISGLMSGATKG